MSTLATRVDHAATHPVDVHVEPALDRRNRWTAAFRPLLALPHLVLVGGPVAAGLTWTWGADGGSRWDTGTGGVLGAAAVVVTLVAWGAILLTGRHPDGLWSLAAYYLRWRVRAVAYVTLLRDEYPPFGDGAYPATLELRAPDGPRDRLTVAVRLLLALPHVVAVWALGVAWAVTTVVAWLAILFTGRMPASLHRFGVGVLRWGTRLEAYLLLLHDEYPPFSLA
jgi:hypothetical protein